MRLLACSDVHGHVEDVRRLRELERDRFDAVVVAGDMSGTGARAGAAGEMLELLGSFGCPVMFMLGNWDRRVRHEPGLFAPAHHLQSAPVLVAGFCFVGYSGCDAGWGDNPVFRLRRREVEARHPRVMEAVLAAREGPTGRARLAALRSTPDWDACAADLRALRTAVPRENADLAMAMARDAGVPPCRTVFVSHARTMRLPSRHPGVRLHLFGHAHGFRHTRSAGLDCVNVSALDMRRPAAPAGDTSRPPGCNDGTYTMLEVSEQAVSASGIRLWEPGPVAAPLLHATGPRT